MPTHGKPTPQIGDLFYCTEQGRLYILVSYEFDHRCKITFYDYCRSKLKRLDDGAIKCWCKPQHEFYMKYKPLNSETK